MLAPGNPQDPVQFIDARDLAEWTIRMVEAGETSIYNAVGPATQFGVGDMLEGIRTANNSKEAKFTWVDADFLEAQKVAPWSDMPVWVPPGGEDGGLSRTGVKRALAKGITFRPLADTASDTLAWFKAQPVERQAKLRAGLTPEREADVLKAWHERKK